MRSKKKKKTKCRTFSVKGCLGFSETNTSTRSPNLSPCLPEDQTCFLENMYFLAFLICPFPQAQSTDTFFFNSHPYLISHPSYHLITYSSLPHFLKKWCMLTTWLYFLSIHFSLTETMVPTPSSLLRFVHPLLGTYDALA